MRLCAIEGCGRKHYGNGFCNKHYKANRTNGDPLVNKRSVHRPLVERFWEKVIVKEGCWDWSGAKTLLGYCVIRDEYPKKGNQFGHRVSYTIHKGEISDGMNILHKCDNPSCVNPDHLEQGTQKQNVHDMMAKGRRTKTIGLKGSDSPRSKLTWDDVRKIRELLSEGVLRQKDIGEMFSVTGATINYIHLNKTWKIDHEN